MESNTFIKKPYTDENIIIYLHFRGENTVRQIEVSTDRIIKLSEDNPFMGDSFLYDQNLSDVEWSPDDYISEDEFESMWNKNLKKRWFDKFNILHNQ